MSYEQFTSTAAPKETSFPTQSALDEVHAYMKQAKKSEPLNNIVKTDIPKMSLGADAKEPVERAKVGDKADPAASPTNEKFLAAWKEATKDLAKGPAGALLEELGKELANNKLDPKKLQELMNSANFGKMDEEQMDKLFGQLKDVARKMKEAHVVKIDVSVNGKGIKGISIDEGVERGPNASVWIPKEGKASASDIVMAGFAPGVAETISIDKAMSRISKRAAQ